MWLFFKEKLLLVFIMNIDEGAFLSDIILLEVLCCARSMVCMHDYMKRIDMHSSLNKEQKISTLKCLKSFSTIFPEWRGEF